jgi:hypothetical protein
MNKFVEIGEILIIYCVAFIKFYDTLKKNNK